MARYIDADKIHEFVDAKVAEGKDGWAKGVPYEWAYALTVIDMQPAADVVPKSELEHILSDLKKQIHDKAVYPNCHGVDPYISLKVFDAVINKLIGS